MNSMLRETLTIATRAPLQWGPTLLASLALGAAAALTPSSLHAGEVALMPTRLHVSIPPGQDYTHVLQVMYGKDRVEDTHALRLVLTEEDWDQEFDGQMTFMKGEPGDSSVRPWLAISPREQELIPGETGEVRVSIVVPEDASPGEYRTALVLQPRVPYRELREGEKRLDFRLRLSTVIYVEVPPVRAGAELTGLDVVPGDKGWSIRSTFSNPGDVHLRLTDEYEVYEIHGGAGAVPFLREDAEAGGPAGQRDESEGPGRPDPQLRAPDRLVLRGDATEAGIVLPGRERYFDRPFGDFALYPGTFRLVYRVDTGRELPLLVGERIFEIPEPHPAVAGDVGR